ncbi:MAG TPA: hypothetical protein P5572_11270 [Phycisphaerae bacterium]|nr:hypothetical protein [Phycisphaerae bacterium]
MKRRSNQIAWILFIAASATGLGCTPLEHGVRDGINEGFNAAIATLIEAPFAYLVDQWLAGGN